MSYLPDYKFAAQKAIEVLEDSDITQAPIVLERILDRYSEIALVPYSKFMKQQEMTLDEAIEFFASDLGACIYEPSTNHFIIYYNDAKSVEWIRFTVAHELGHIFLEHLQKAGSSIINAVSIPDEDYKNYEKEANVFARNLLSPAPLAQYIVDDSAENYMNCSDLQSAFWITERASQFRLYYLNRDMVDYNSDMIAVTKGIKMRYRRYCQRCHTSVPKGAIFCITCGYAMLTKGTEFQMLPASVKFSERGRLIHCVKCGNKEVTPGSWFCKICGTPIINLCYGNKDRIIQKRHINPSNALFCGACGNRTVFNEYQVPMNMKEVPAMRYTDGVDYDSKTMRVKICPRCQNEEFDEEASFCKICGLALINYCEGVERNDDTYGEKYYEDQHPNPSNARFCEKCGKPTTFFKERVLVDFERYQRQEATQDDPDYMTIPGDDDMDLPFA